MLINLYCFQNHQEPVTTGLTQAVVRTLGSDMYHTDTVKYTIA